MEAALMQIGVAVLAFISSRGLVIGKLLPFGIAFLSYSADEGMALFLSHEIPAVYILSGGELSLAREMRETTDFHMERRKEN